MKETPLIIAYDNKTIAHKGRSLTIAMGAVNVRRSIEETLLRACCTSTHCPRVLGALARLFELLPERQAELDRAQAEREREEVR